MPSSTGERMATKYRARTVPASLGSGANEGNCTSRGGPTTSGATAAGGAAETTATKAGGANATNATKAGATAWRDDSDGDGCNGDWRGGDGCNSSHHDSRDGNRWCNCN